MELSTLKEDSAGLASPQALKAQLALAGLRPSGATEAIYHSGHQPPVRVYRVPDPAVRVEGFSIAPANSMEVPGDF